MNDYHINIFFSDADAGFIAGIPDLNACSAFGETPQDAVAEVVQARDAWLAVARETGRDVPPPRYRPPSTRADGPAHRVGGRHPRNGFSPAPHTRHDDARRRRHAADHVQVRRRAVEQAGPEHDQVAVEAVAHLRHPDGYFDRCGVLVVVRGTPMRADSCACHDQFTVRDDCLSCPATRPVPQSEGDTTCAAT